MAFGNLTDQLAILRRQDLTSTEKFVAVVALSFRNSESGRCNPPIVSDDAEKETLCSRSGYTKQCITKTLASLEAKGVIALKKAIARPSAITFTVNDVYGKQGLPSTTITATVNDVYGKGKRRLPITDKEQIKNRQVLIGDFQPHAHVHEVTHVKEPAHVQETTSRCAGSCTADVQEPAHRREQLKEQEENSNDSRDLFDDSDQKTNRGAAKTEKTQRNSLIRKENRGAPLMAPSPADSASEIASKSLIQKENEGADTPARTSVKKAAKVEPQGSRFTLEELPDNWHSECRRIQPKADPAKVFEEFRDYWISVPGAKGRKSDWTATWRNWCRKLNPKDLERVGYEPGRSQFMVKPEPVNPFKVTPQNCPPRQKTEEELEAERSFDLFERVLNGEV